MLRSLVRKVAPRFLLNMYAESKIVSQAIRLSKAAASSSDLDKHLDLVIAEPAFRPIQRRSEIERLCRMVKSSAPKNIVEIGAAGGGTAFLFAQTTPVDATIISIDLSFGAPRLKGVPLFAKGSQRLICVEADSHVQATVDRVRTLLIENGACDDGHGLIDFLYIDGDHSYEGVKCDFELFSPLVKDGGLIAFHDIVQDHGQRYGKVTTASTGGVPKYWQEIKAKYSDGSPSDSNAALVFTEIVEDYDQDGYGIGVVHWKR